MKKFRTLGFGIVVAAGLAMFGTGVATAEETTPDTGSATLLESLSSGSAGTEATDKAKVKAIEETDPEADTGSATGLAALLEALTTGSAGAEEPATDADTITEEEPVETGSAEGLAAVLQGLLTGSAGAEEPDTEPTE
ncbi:hypothetical protein [Nocardia neocaledoniensis]|uniref:hypothetical protein n=1 Tax=Nocardia neocaledoniensis TaxID=236511 RepID=UPI002454F18A|nr:hypothetical protein [Nocardia neocaledoniensis]